MTNRTSRPKGFTFIELMLVAVIIAVLAATAVPRMRRAFARFELENFVKGIYDLSAYLQASAASRGQIYCLEIDPQKLSLCPVYKEGDKFKSIPGRFSRPRQAPAGVVFFTEKKMLCFYPDSSVDEARLDFEDTYKDRLSLFFQGVSGGMEIR